MPIFCRCSPIRQSARTSKVLVCLAYPCNEERWLSLRARNLLVHRASLPLTDRRVELILVAFPLSTRVIEGSRQPNGGRDPSPGSIVTKLSFAASDTSLCGSGTVGADRLFHSLDMGDPFGVLAGFIFGTIFALPQRQRFRFERIVDFGPIFSRQPDHTASLLRFEEICVNCNKNVPAAGHLRRARCDRV